MGKGRKRKGEKRSYVADPQRRVNLRLSLTIIGILAIILVSVWRFWANTTSRPPYPKHRERLRYAMREPLELNDPAITRTPENRLWLAQVCEGLVRFARNSVEIEPALAELYTASGDHKEWTFHLRKGVRFHDGTKFDSRAVHFCYMRLLDPNNPYHLAGMFAAAREIFGDERQTSSPMLVDIQTPDDFTVRFLLSRPDVSFLRRLARVEASIMSPSAIQTAASEGQTTIVGTGPMRIKTVREGTYLVLERNSNYWGPLASMGELEFRCILSSNERERALREQLSDIAQRFSPERLTQLQKVRHLQIRQAPSVHCCVLLLNSNVAPLDQPEVRQALSLAIDRDQLVQRALNGYGVSARSFFPRAIAEAPTAAPVLDATARLDDARVLLHKAGMDKGFALKLLVPKEERVWNPAGSLVGELLTELLREIQLTLTCEVAPAAEVGQRIFSGNFQVALWGLTSASGDPTDYMGTFLKLASTAERSPTDTTRFFATKVAELRECWDRTQRQVLLDSMEKELARQMPWIPLFQADQILVTHRQLTNVELQPLGLHRLWAAQWFEEENR